jgi:hypothetical protein
LGGAIPLLRAITYIFTPMDGLKIKENIEKLEDALSNPQLSYSLDDKQVIINTTFKSTDDILKAICYFKSLQISLDN